MYIYECLCAVNNNDPLPIVQFTVLQTKRPLCTLMDCTFIKCTMSVHLLGSNIMCKQSSHKNLLVIIIDMIYICLHVYLYYTVL